MRKVLKIARVFAFSPELLLVVIGVVVEWAFDGKIDNLISRINISDDLFKWAIAIPGVLLCWSLVSGRKLLFPDKDKNNILQRWPDYWILKICFHVALVWNLIFTIISIYAWMGDWKHPSSSHFVALIMSIVGSAVCSLSVYNAQTRVEEEVSQYAGNQ